MATRLLIFRFSLSAKDADRGGFHRVSAALRSARCRHAQFYVGDDANQNEWLPDYWNVTVEIGRGASGRPSFLESLYGLLVHEISGGHKFA